jgi:hypothetical protein
MGYQLWWYDTDGRFRKRTVRGIDRDEAVRLERALLAARDRGEAPVDECRAPSFDAFAKMWIEEGRAGWKASTMAQYQPMLRSQLVPALGAHQVSAISEARIRQLITGLHDAGLSARRLNLTLLVLKMILRTALRRRYLRDDPTETIRSLRGGVSGLVAALLHGRLLDGRPAERAGGASMGRRRHWPWDRPHPGGPLSREGRPAKNGQQRARY